MDGSTPLSGRNALWITPEHQHRRRPIQRLNPQTPIMVFGDAMADWLGYGLELAYADSPEVGIVRQHRTNSGLIRPDVRNDPQGEYPDWPKMAREMIAVLKPKFVLMMIGLNDRKQIREATQSEKPAETATITEPVDRPEPVPAPKLRLPFPRRRAPAATILSNSAPTPGARLISGGSTIPSPRSRHPAYRSSGSDCRYCAGEIVRRHSVSRRSLSQPCRQGWHRLCRRLGRLRRRGRPLRPVGSRFRRPDAAPARWRRRPLYPGRVAQARPFRRARDRALAECARCHSFVARGTARAARDRSGRRARQARLEGEAARRSGRLIDLREFRRIRRTARWKCPLQNH